MLCDDDAVLYATWPVDNSNLLILVACGLLGDIQE